MYTVPADEHINAGFTGSNSVYPPRTMCMGAQVCQRKDGTNFTPPLAANLGNTNTTYSEVVLQTHTKELDTKLSGNVLTMEDWGACIRIYEVLSA